MIDRLTIRMYKVGFGDCFLLSLKSQADTHHILFDCGSLSQSKARVAKIAKHIKETCTKPGGKARIALVVGTHRHKDHVVGFDDAIWQDIEVDEVWMPWTEDPDDSEATQIRNKQSAFAMALCREMALDPAANKSPLVVAASASAIKAQHALAWNALTNAKAMATLHRGFAGNPPRRFLPAKDVEAEIRTLAALPEVRFHILGPSRDKKTIAEMNPPAGKAYVGATTDGSRSQPGGGACATIWRISESEFRRQTRNKTTFSNADRKDIEEAADDPEGDLAAALDNAVNNTSLMMLIEVGDQFLLFPGDAQWGTWDAVLQQPRLRRILERTTVFKVSHHGSHNGTPREFVETMIGKGVTSFMSTGTVRQWPGIPRESLVEALVKKTRLARSDRNAALKASAGFTTQNDLYIEWETEVRAS